MLAASSAMELEVWLTAAASSSDCPRTRLTLAPRRCTLESTDLRLAAISSMAAEVSSAPEAWTEVVWLSSALEELICTAPAPTSSAAERTRPTTSASWADMRERAAPSWSFSPLASTERLRSPSAIRSM
ncbi:hypothetical protein D3C87_1563870 [compost metagenome]